MSDTNTLVVPVIGQPWPEQGGIYVGSRLINNWMHHIIVAGGPETDAIDVTWNNAQKAVSDMGDINGHADWRAPDQRDLMLAYVNTPDLFDKDDWYWSSSQYSEGNAWAIDFEDGSIGDWRKNNEFRVRPFRSIIASSI